MPTETLVDVLRDEAGRVPDSFDRNAIDRILTEPQQDALAEAIAADLVDAVPVAGDLLFLSRKEAAERQGVQYPAKPTAIENAASDLPPPLDTVADLAISQNVLHYLQTNTGVDIANLPEEATNDLTQNINDAAEALANKAPSPGGN